MVKNKVAPPFRRAEFDIVYGEGISRVGEILDLAVENDIIKKSGSWFGYGDKKLGQGRDATKETLAKDEKLLAEIEKAVLAFLKDGKRVDPAAAPAPKKAAKKSADETPEDDD